MRAKSARPGSKDLLSVRRGSRTKLCLPIPSDVPLVTKVLPTEPRSIRASVSFKFSMTASEVEWPRTDVHEVVLSDYASDSTSVSTKAQMAKNRQQMLPLSEVDRDQIIQSCVTADEPVTAAELVKANVATRKVTALEVTSLLDEMIATGRLHQWPAKTAKGQPRYWGRDTVSTILDEVKAVCQQMDAPLTSKEILKKVKVPIKLSEDELVAVLETLIKASLIYPISAAGKKGKARFWNHDSTEFAHRTVKQILADKGPQTEAALKKTLNWLNAQEFHNLLDELLQSSEIRRYPKLGKNEAFGLQPPRAYPYLKEIQSQLTKMVAALVEVGVSTSELRRATIQMLEQAGITFGDHGQSATIIDLISVMKQIEPGAANGALVGARDLRRAVKLEKSDFDRMVLALSEHGRLSLHRHDYPSSLSDQERDELVTDGSGSFFVGIALRQNS